MTKGNLLIISAASGAGKTSLVKALLEKDAGLKLSISHTTRAPRPGEKNGVDYHFVDEPTFLEILSKGGFLESALVHGARYGTSQQLVNETLASGMDVILEIDWQGAEQVRLAYPDAVSIFILPPSIEVLAQRLKSRGQDSQAVIDKRLAAARAEMANLGSYDYVTINDNFETALEDIQAIVKAARLTTVSQLARHASLIRSLT
jgi:guanylate kinase